MQVRMPDLSTCDIWNVLVNSSKQFRPQLCEGHRLSSKWDFEFSASSCIIMPEVKPCVPIPFCRTLSWETKIGPLFEWAWVEYKTL